MKNHLYKLGREVNTYLKENWLLPVEVEEIRELLFNKFEKKYIKFHLKTVMTTNTNIRVITKEELEEYLPILDEVLTMADEKFCD